jgi:probable rRNA maturation factor
MLALSVDAVRREAWLYGRDPAEYCRRLLAHGLAHVLGYDHGPAMDALAARMLDCDG